MTVVQQLSGGVVQARFRFVQQQQSGPVQEGPGEGDTPLQTVRQFPGEVVKTVLYLHDAGDLGHPVVAVGHAEHSCVEVQVFPRRQVAVEHGGVQRRAGHLPDDFTGSRRVPAVDAYGPRVGAREGCEDAEQGGLTGAVWAEKSQDFVRVHVEVNAP